MDHSAKPISSIYGSNGGTMRTVAWIYGSGATLLLVAWLCAAQFPAAYLSLHLERGIDPFALRWAVTQAIENLRNTSTRYCDAPFLFAYQGSWGTNLLFFDDTGPPNGATYRVLTTHNPHYGTLETMAEFNQALLDRCF